MCYTPKPCAVIIMYIRHKSAACEIIVKIQSIGSNIGHCVMNRLRGMIFPELRCDSLQNPRTIQKAFFEKWMNGTPTRLSPIFLLSIGGHRYDSVYSSRLCHSHATYLISYVAAVDVVVARLTERAGYRIVHTAPIAISVWMPRKCHNL